MKKFTLIIASLFITAGIFAQSATPAQSISDVKLNKILLSPAEAEDCEQEGADFDWILGDFDILVYADDLEVAPGISFFLETVVAYYTINTGGDFSDIIFSVYEDEDGNPGAEIDGYTGTIVNEIVQQDALPGIDLGVIVFGFETPIELKGGAEGTNYWFGFTGENDGEAGILTSDAQSFGSEFMIGFQGEWIAGSEGFNLGGVYDLAIDFYGTCDETETTSVTQEKLAEVNVYPNPTKDFIYIKAEGQEKNISIVSVTGEEVLNETFIGNTSINLDNLTNGVYVYTIRDNNKEVIKASKLIIQK